jgi:hypothetical protein
MKTRSSFHTLPVACAVRAVTAVAVNFVCGSDIVMAGCWSKYLAGLFRGCSASIECIFLDKRSPDYGGEKPKSNSSEGMVKYKFA